MAALDENAVLKVKADEECRGRGEGAGPCSAAGFRVVRRVCCSSYSHKISVVP